MEYSEMRLVSLGVLNGAPQSWKGYQRYGLAGKFKVQVAGKGNMSEAIGERLKMQGERDHYRPFKLLSLFSEDFLSTRFPQTNGMVKSGEVGHWRKRIGYKDYILRVEAGLPGKVKNESCISELFPVYLN